MEMRHFQTVGPMTSTPNKFVFAIHRGGSSVLGGIVKACAQASNEQAVILGGTEKAFKEVSPDGAATKLAGGGNAPSYEPNLANWQDRSGVFSPIRRADFFPPEVFAPGDIALLNMRDPRDCMVSGYFGFLRLHGKGLDDANRQRWYDMGIDAYVLEVMVDRYVTACRDYIALGQQIAPLHLLTYEDMVTDFPTWFRAFYTALAFDEAQFDRLVAQQAAKFDAPETEDIDQHKRQMLPGDYLRKLKPETIDEINSRMGPELAHFGYL